MSVLTHVPHLLDTVVLDGAEWALPVPGRSWDLASAWFCCCLHASIMALSLRSLSSGSLPDVPFGKGAGAK